MEFYSAITNKDFMSFARKWMELEVSLICAIYGENSRGSIMDVDGEKGMGDEEE
jgi:hypothetical protein